MPLVYAELRRLARRYMRAERVDHTLQPTALVHEAYLRLAGQREMKWQNRAHFFGVAAQLMRRFGGPRPRSPGGEAGGDDVNLTLDEALVFKPAQRTRTFWRWMRP